MRGIERTIKTIANRGAKNRKDDEKDEEIKEKKRRTKRKQKHATSQCDGRVQGRVLVARSSSRLQLSSESGGGSHVNAGRVTWDVSTKGR